MSRFHNSLDLTSLGKRSYLQALTRGVEHKLEKVVHRANDIENQIKLLLASVTLVSRLDAMKLLSLLACPITSTLLYLRSFQTPEKTDPRLHKANKRRPPRRRT